MGDFKERHLLPGFRFNPTDEEMISSYLAPKVRNELDMDCDWYIHEKNIYEYDSPSDLFQEFQSNHSRYFFSKIKKVSPNSKKVKRCTGDGTWKGEDKGADITDNDEIIIGTRKQFTFKWNVSKEKTPSAGKPERGRWIMHEYALPPKFYQLHGIEDEWVLCMIKTKTPLLNNTAPIEQPSPRRQPTKNPRTTMLRTSMDIVNASLGNGPATPYASPLSEKTTMPLFKGKEVSPPTVMPSMSPFMASSSTKVPLNNSMYGDDCFDLLAEINENCDVMDAISMSFPDAVNQTTIMGPDECHYPDHWHRYAYDQSNFSNTLIDNNAFPFSSPGQFPENNLLRLPEDGTTYAGPTSSSTMPFHQQHLTQDDSQVGARNTCGYQFTNSPIGEMQELPDTEEDINEFIEKLCI
ncbi:NAC domain-containing protein 96-like isoform X2 [Papaver somniferum]|nr:NAC domain-containing protein 96-like isoform X2 [Papaver somniferum]XP_026385265.1 NAC domain-containing protein 96-like isoform X2 [Papaver somniferum]XP_026385266.1 NAC domain-containing protein 96-like isoform X2 [Papaver somniferum]